MKSNDQLVDHLVEQGYIESERVEKAFRNVDRKKFVPAAYRESAYRDTPLPIAGDATVSAPHMVAINTELLDIQPDSTAVEIGSGSGYQLAIISELASEVTGVELVPELVEKSRERLADRKNVAVREGSGFEPVGKQKFDRILYSCAIDSLQEAEEHLLPGGIAVAPVNSGRGQVLKKLEDGKVTDHGRVRFVQFRDN